MYGSKKVAPPIPPGVLRRTLLSATAALVGPATLAAQSGSSGGAWYGVPLPPAFEAHAVPALVGARGPLPALVPPGEEGYRDLAGERIRNDLEAIVGFSVESRERREIGDGQLWGRITGFPSGARTIEWAVAQFRDAGIADVELQMFPQQAGASLWLPTSWEVRLLGDPAFGPGSRDVSLESAMPLSGTELPDGLTAPLVYVGTATPAELAYIDVSGKVAVQKVIPQAHTVFTRGPTGQRGEDLLARGAVAVLNIVDLPGNVRVRDMGCGGGPCFNIGGRDGRFLESVMNAAAEAGALDRLRLRMRSEGERFSGLSGANGVAVVPGSESDETIIVNAHADAWFDGAGDNGDGLAVLIALARHFAKPEHRPARTLVFVASAGHHSSGLNGPGNFVAMNPDLTANAVMVINIEHVAQRNLSLARSRSADGYQEWVADVHEAPIVAGVPNQAPFLEALIRRGVERYGTNFVSEPSTQACGDCGGYRSLGVAQLTAMQAPPLYHTSGEALEAISIPGLERMARFLAFFIEEVDRAPAALIDPPGGA